MFNGLAFYFSVFTFNRLCKDNEKMHPVQSTYSESYWHGRFVWLQWYVVFVILLSKCSISISAWRNNWCLCGIKILYDSFPIYPSICPFIHLFIRRFIHYVTPPVLPSPLDISKQRFLVKRRIENVIPNRITFLALFPST